MDKKIRHPMLDFLSYGRCPRGMGDVDRHDQLGLVHRIFKGKECCIRGGHPPTREYLPREMDK